MVTVKVYFKIPTVVLKINRVLQICSEDAEGTIKTWQKESPEYVLIIEKQNEDNMLFNHKAMNIPHFLNVLERIDPMNK